MGIQVCTGAMMMCSFGVAPSSLVVLPQNRTLTGTPAANIMDNKPIVNIPPFGMCMSPANPMDSLTGRMRSSLVSGQCPKTMNGGG